MDALLEHIGTATVHPLASFSGGWVQGTRCLIGSAAKFNNSGRILETLRAVNVCERGLDLRAHFCY